MQVLIAEDDAALGLFLQKGLKLEGHEVMWVGDGETALEHARVWRPDLMVLDLSLQWSCSVLDTEGFTPERMALVMPRMFVEEFGAVPLRVRGERVLSLAFEDRLDASVALAVEKMTELQVQSGLVEGAKLRVARQRLLRCDTVAAQEEAVGDADGLTGRITALLEQKQPLDSRLVRLHRYYWLRLWLESGTKDRTGSLPTSTEDMQDYVFTIGF